MPGTDSRGNSPNREESVEAQLAAARQVIREMTEAAQDRSIKAESAEYERAEAIQQIREHSSLVSRLKIWIGVNKSAGLLRYRNQQEVLDVINRETRGETNSTKDF